MTYTDDESADDQHWDIGCDAHYNGADAKQDIGKHYGRLAAVRVAHRSPDQAAHSRPQLRERHDRLITCHLYDLRRSQVL